MKTIGCDVEVFGLSVETANHVSLCGLIGGSKEKPLQLADLPKGYCVQEDNVSLEFNIPPAMSRDSFVSSLSIMSKNVPAILQKHGLKVSKECAVSFAKEQLTHPNALIFGCEPDYNAWTMMENDKPQSDDVALRTAGGHIHVGTDANMIDVVKWMDVYLGVPSIILDDSEGSVRRRQLYGRAGAMRPKPYGLEYRVLSNFWIFHTKLAGWVYDQTQQAVHMAKAKGAPGVRLTNAVVNIINSGNKEKAIELCQKNQVKYEL